MKDLNVMAFAAHTKTQSIGMNLKLNLPLYLRFHYLCHQHILYPSYLFVISYRPPNLSKTDDENLIDASANLCSVFIPIVLLGDFKLDIDWQQ